MKIVRYSTLAVVAIAAVANSAWAQTQTQGQWSRVTYVAAAPGDEEGQASPSDIDIPTPPKNEEEAPAIVSDPVDPIVMPGGMATAPYAPSCVSEPSCGVSPSCRSYSCCSRRCRTACPLDCPDCPAWTLCDENCRGWFVNGWMNAGFYGNSHGNGRNGGNGPIPFNFNGNRAQLNQAWINAGKHMVFDDCNQFDWGWNIDYVYGTDGPATQSFGDQGWDFGWNSSATYGSAIPQLYVEAGTEQLSVKVGHFYTIIGYEVVQAPGNFFYSHAYTMNFGEPFTHTGALATWTPNDETTVWGGYTYGWDSGFENGLEAHTFLGGVSRQINDSTTITYAANIGQFGDGTGVNGAPGLSSGDIYMHSIVIDKQVNDRTNVVFQSDYGTNQNVPGGGNGEWYGLNGYIFYDLTCKLRSGIRAEWFADPNGLRVGNGNGDYFALTGGFNYAMTPNFMLRPEVRYDTYDAYGGNPNRAFNPSVNGVNQSSSQWSYGIDGIWTF
ncbi:MAG: porin [bacterium]|nr:porin [bacterium]